MLEDGGTAASLCPRCMCHSQQKALVGLSRKFWSGKNIGPGDQYSRKCSENIGPSLKIWVRLATVSGKSAKIVFSGAVVSFKRFNS